MDDLDCVSCGDQEDDRAGMAIIESEQGQARIAIIGLIITRSVKKLSVKSL
jgi:hypothetical protein